MTGRYRLHVDLDGSYPGGLFGAVSGAARLSGAFVDAAAGLTETMTQLQASVRTATAVGAAVGPAVAAAFQAFRAIRAQDAPDFRSMPDGTDESPAGLPPREASDERQ